MISESCAGVFFENFYKSHEYPGVFKYSNSTWKIKFYINGQRQKIHSKYGVMLRQRCPNTTPRARAHAAQQKKAIRIMNTHCMAAL